MNCLRPWLRVLCVLLFNLRLRLLFNPDRKLPTSAIPLPTSHDLVPPHRGRTLKEVFAGMPSVVQDKALAQMAAILKENGYAVYKRRALETPGELAKRLGVCHQTILRKIADARCPQVDLHRTRGTTGSIRYIASNPAFDAWCREGFLTPLRLARKFKVDIDEIRAVLADPTMPAVDCATLTPDGALISWLSSPRWSTWFITTLSIRNPHLAKA